MNVKMVTFSKALKMTEHRLPRPHKRINIFAGGYGSGKTEVAVNYASYLAKSGIMPLSIVDLDIVNPYFRSREAATLLTDLGVNVIIPTGEQCSADLPIILPQVKGAIESEEGSLIIDLGGDDVGGRVLSSMADSFAADKYDMFFVLNANRPFTSDLASALKMIEDIQISCRLKFTGIASNTHLIDETDRETIMRGVKLAREVEKETGIELKLVCAIAEIFDTIKPEEIECEVLPLSRYMLKPWEVKSR